MEDFMLGDPAGKLKSIVVQIFDLMQLFKSSQKVLCTVIEKPEQFITNHEKLECAKNLLLIIELVQTREDIFVDASRKDYLRYFPKMTQEILNMPQSLFDKQSDSPIYPEKMLLTLGGISGTLEGAIKYLPEQAVNSYCELLSELREKINKDDLPAVLKQVIFARIRDLEKALVVPGLDAEKAIRKAVEELELGMEFVCTKNTVSPENKEWYASTVDAVRKGIIISLLIGGSQWALEAIEPHLPAPFQSLASAARNLLPAPNETSHQEKTSEDGMPQLPPGCQE